MAIKFLQQKKKQKYLILILVIVIIITILVWRFGLFDEEEFIFPSTVEPISREITINFEVLEDSELKELQLFEEIPPFGLKPGRENPFVVY